MEKQIKYIQIEKDNAAPVSYTHLYQSHSAIILVVSIKTAQSIIRNIIRTPFRIFTNVNKGICMNAMTFQA